MHLEGWGEAHDVEGDPGGLTVFGISSNAWPEMYRNGNPTEHQAREFYRTKYWNRLLLDRLDSHDMAFQIFEFSVNSGDGVGREKSVKVAQRAANRIIGLVNNMNRPLVRLDGRMGPKTLSALNTIAAWGWKYRVGWVRFYNKYQLEYYESLSEDLQRRFLLGWAIQRT